MGTAALIGEGLCWIPVEGESMWPVLRGGDRVGVVGLEGRAPRVGEVIVARQGNRMVVHRVARRVGDRIFMKGDSRPSEDSPVLLSNVLGRVRFVERLGRTLDETDWNRPTGEAGRFVFRVLKRLARAAG